MCSCNLTQLLTDIQYSLADRVIEEDCFCKLDRVAGADISFSVDNRAVAAVVVLELEGLEVVEKKTLDVELFFPYISGFLGVREADAVISVINTLEHGFDVLMVNGHGVMHPAGFGLASHVGVLLDVPTMGVAKRLIGGRYIKLATQSDHTPEIQLIKYDNRVVGAFFKGKYLSVGHRISLKSVLEITMRTSVFKIPEPLRQAHILATETFKHELNGN
ncbi:endonuclease V [Methanobacterium ferruginis]|jgi:deoxyribonuclease V|uniref:endonuclease V n=1 Tax=Methanobacterium ferruginis TaxID=710191 RepID=UPI002572C614|nr:endonuclease V [Methanobacterium ferruginis]BDZ67354.1 endonuclease V [Methanobacterium ferruginis]